MSSKTNISDLSQDKRRRSSRGCHTGLSRMALEHLHHRATITPSIWPQDLDVINHFTNRRFIYEPDGEFRIKAITISVLSVSHSSSVVFLYFSSVFISTLSDILRSFVNDAKSPAESRRFFERSERRRCNNPGRYLDPFLPVYLWNWVLCKGVRKDFPCS